MIKTFPVGSQIDIDHVEKILSELEPERIPNNNNSSRAAVALILSEDEECGTSIFFIKRTEDERDPWSGHMAFPGGRVEKSDADLLDTAIRETYEETGIDLKNGKILGMMGEVQSMRPDIKLIITPFVAVAPQNLDDLDICENDEVDEVVKIPISKMKKRSRKVKYGGLYQQYSTYRYKGYMIWGLTAWILDQFFSISGLQPDNDKRPSNNHTSNLTNRKQ